MPLWLALIALAGDPFDFVEGQTVFVLCPDTSIRAVDDGGGTSRVRIPFNSQAVIVKAAKRGPGPNHILRLATGEQGELTNMGERCLSVGPFSKTDDNLVYVQKSGGQMVVWKEGRGRNKVLAVGARLWRASQFVYVDENGDAGGLHRGTVVGRTPPSAAKRVYVWAAGLDCGYRGRRQPPTKLRLDDALVQLGDGLYLGEERCKVDERYMGANPLAGSEQRFVAASSLNLRDAPGADAVVVKQLAINAPLTLIREEGAYVFVRSGGERGFVASRFVRRTMMTTSEASESMGDPALSLKERLNWGWRWYAWERARERGPRAPSLQHTLVDAFMRAVRDPSPRTAVFAHLYLQTIPPMAASTEPWFVPVSHRVGRDFEVELTPRELGLGEVKVWVLPAAGPAVTTTIHSLATRKIPRSKGMAVGFVLEPEASVRPVAFAFSEPPPSWNTSATPTLSRLDAEARFATDRIAREEGAESLHIVPAGDGWVAFSTWTVPDPRSPTGAQKRRSRALKLDDRGQLALLSDPGAAPRQVPSDPAHEDFDRGFYKFTLALQGARDVDGDGEVDYLWTTSCGVGAIVRRDGSQLFASADCGSPAR